MGISSDLLKSVHKDKAQLDRLPELGWNERQTSSYIRRTLPGHPIFSEKTALVYGVGRGKPVFFRAELDALSTPSGVKHVCGHSAHMAALMGAYRYFYQYPPKGNRVYFIFQPCEEGYPSGAQFLSERWKPLRSCSFGAAFHAFPGSSPGVIVVPTMAGCDYVEVKLNGISTHIKNKYTMETQDCLIAASQLAFRLNRSSYRSVIMNIGILRAGETPNSIAGNASLAGDVRWLTMSGQSRAKLRFEHEVACIRRSYPSLTIDASYHVGYPQLACDPVLLNAVRSYLPRFQDHTTFATEDFSLYPVRKLFLFVATGQKWELHEERFVVPRAVVEALFNYWILLGTSLSRM